MESLPTNSPEAVSAATSSPEHLPFPTLSALRRSHSALLKQREDTAGQSPTVEEIMAFMHRAQVSGTTIADPGSRDSAQTILDYWYGVAIRDSGGARGRSVEALTLDDYTGAPEAEVSECETESLARKTEDLKRAALAFPASGTSNLQSQPPAPPLTTQLAGWLSTATASKEEVKDGGKLRLLLLRLFTLTASGSPQRAQLAFGDALLNDDEAKKLCDELSSAGLLRKEISGGATEPNAFILADESLFKTWPALEEVVKERRSVRLLTAGWERAGRPNSALLEDGRVLRGAEDYVDRSMAENAFLTKSREIADEKSRRKTSTMWRVVIALGVLASALLVACLFLFWRHQDLKNLVDEKDRLVTLERDQRRIAEHNAANYLAQRDEAIKFKQEAEDATLKNRNVLAQLTSQKNLSPGLQDLVTKYEETLPSDNASPTAQTTRQSLARQLSEPAPGAALQPGMGICTKKDDEPVRGSLGVFVRKAGSSTVYAVVPGYLLAGQPGDIVYAGWQAQRPIGRISSLVPVDHANLQELALVELNPDTVATLSTTVPGGGPITQVAAAPAPETKIFLVGSGSGNRSGTVISSTGADLLLTTDISSPGDGGAPVLTQDDNKLLGILIGSGKGGSQVRLIQPFLNANQLTLYTPAITHPFAGALAEIFVSAENPAAIQDAQKYVKALQNAGITLPVPTAQPRKRVASGKSEVRYFYAEDKPLADEVMAVLLQHGFTESTLTTKETPDPENYTPKRFIQISLAKDAPGLQAPLPPIFPPSTLPPSPPLVVPPS
jgi:hypothetical protein